MAGSSHRCRGRAGGFCAALLVASVCEAESTNLPAAARWHAGIELRPGYAVRPLRLGGGVGWTALEARLVLDPLAFIDGIHDLDLSGAYWLGASGYALSAGWRSTTVFLDDETEWHQTVLVGALARLPTLGWTGFRAVAGLEFSALLFRHGGGLPASASCWCDGLSASETLGFSVFVRMEYAAPG